MKPLSGPGKLQKASKNSQQSDIKYWMKYLLYNESKNHRWNISHDMNMEVGKYDKFMIGKKANT